MSMGMGLHGIRDFLRREHSWTENQCGVQYRCLPPATAGHFYVGLDDSGADSGPEDTDALTEILNIEIGVWQRPSGKPADRLGILKLPQDIYLAGIYSNTQLERKVMIPTGAIKQKGGLHMNYGLLIFINELFRLPNECDGTGFFEPLKFRGYSRFESIAIPDSNDATAFYGRRLRFRGLKRTQNVRATIG